jgi:hypothetical protein
MRVILINPWDQSVTEAEHSGDWRDYYRLLSGPTLQGLEDAQVSCFDMTRLDGPLADHLLVVDDVGFCTDIQAYFGLCDRTFAGRGVIVRDGDGEEDQATDLTIKAVREAVCFVPVGVLVAAEPTVVTGFDTAEALFEYLDRRLAPLTPERRTAT